MLVQQLRRDEDVSKVLDEVGILASPKPRIDGSGPSNVRLRQPVAFCVPVCKVWRRSVGKA